MKDKQDLSMFISTKLKQAREELGLTQQEVAELLNRPQSYVSRCEKGIKSLEIHELQAFGEIYKKDIQFFLTE